MEPLVLTICSSQDRCLAMLTSTPPTRIYSCVEVVGMLEVVLWVYLEDSVLYRLSSLLKKDRFDMFCNC